MQERKQYVYLTLLIPKNCKSAFSIVDITRKIWFFNAELINGLLSSLSMKTKLEKTLELCYFGL